MSVGAELTASSAGAVQRVAEKFDRSQLVGSSQSLLEVRRAAVEQFKHVGFPSTHSEEYRHTRIDRLIPLSSSELSSRPVATVDGLPESVLSVEAVATIVFVDGVFSDGLSRLENLPAGVVVHNLNHELATDRAGLLVPVMSSPEPGVNGFYALNTAFAEEGLVLEVSDHVALEAPIHMVHLMTDASCEQTHNVRHVLVLGENSSATVLEEFVSLTEQPYFNNVVRDVRIAEKARLNLVDVVRETGFHISATVGSLPKNAHLSQMGLTLSGELVRRESRMSLRGEGADAVLGGIYLPRNEQVHDQLTWVEHAVPRCTSNQLFKGVLNDRSRGVFNGKVLVQRDAQQTLAYQQNRNLVLSDGATADSRPQLEIYADDVKCSHGATIGQLDADALFYLRSRGVSQAEASRLLMRAFVGEVLDLAPESFREVLLRLTVDALPVERGDLPP